MKLARPLTASLGAVALTLVAAGSALAVNIGILSQHGDPGVGNLDTVATVAADPASPTTQYVTIYVDDPSQVPTVLDPVAQPQATAAPASVASLSDDDAYEHEYEGADFDD
jgi:hypothetical protein